MRKPDPARAPAPILRGRPPGRGSARAGRAALRRAVIDAAARFCRMGGRRSRLPFPGLRNGLTAPETGFRLARTRCAADCRRTAHEADVVSPDALYRAARGFSRQV